jgi:hypothetical protein
VFEHVRRAAGPAKASWRWTSMELLLCHVSVGARGGGQCEHVASHQPQVARRKACWWVVVVVSSPWGPG